MAYNRVCSKCNKILTYTNKYVYNESVKNKRLCRSCGAKKMCLTDEQKFIMASRFGPPRCGKNNPFYGKKHTKEALKIIAEKSVKIGKENGMFGKNVYDIWFIKYGKEEADKRLSALKHIRSINNSGKNNPMYGKPSPMGSGNGWSGWYKGWYFRSLRELSYVITYLERNGLRWVSAEKKEFSIPYQDYNGKDRIYHPDFLVEDNRLVEIKPDKLKKSITNKLKQIAAEKFCTKMGYKFEMIEPKKMGDKQISELYKKGLIKFISRYDKKFKERYLNDKTS
jgi:hypothetical protein